MPPGEVGCRWRLSAVADGCAPKLRCEEDGLTFSAGTLGADYCALSQIKARRALTVGIWLARPCAGRRFAEAHRGRHRC
jgi:hypothetical protein